MTHKSWAEVVFEASRNADAPHRRTDAELLAALPFAPALAGRAALDVGAWVAEPPAWQPIDMKHDPSWSVAVQLPLCEVPADVEPELRAAGFLALGPARWSWLGTGAELLPVEEAKARLGRAGDEIDRFGISYTKQAVVIFRSCDGRVLWLPVGTKLGRWSRVL